LLNWRPVVDYEQREIEFERRMQQMRIEDERLSELNAKLSAISSSSATNSNPANRTPNEFEV
jgi:hypothetical protein